LTCRDSVPLIIIPTNQTINQSYQPDSRDPPSNSRFRDIAKHSPIQSICRINSYCLASQYVSAYIARVVRVSHHMLPMWSECIAICPCGQRVSPYAVSIHIVCMVRCLTIYCPCGQGVSSYIAHVARESHSMLHQCGLHDQYVSRYVVSINTVRIIGIIIYCVSSYCSHGQMVSPYIAHVLGM